ncbi:ECF RNA polymerase sigma factor SigW [Aquisphaera giovannonii]|uniref:ECF RNA polymerase sigma factor SigW n=1 Tax=Aquisphaera giovannonii TaxID=406548 RepID=A0A5B9W7N6_9BACT|nr:RNA polymerase sigma factor [Aquisphaera giovannonii]QEH36031.1 ECF RNA polymerase sigma factor SigW [Aquisphaera giovannonii]
MAETAKGAALRRLEAVFEIGPAGDLTDGELLGRFASGRDDRAFAAIVDRHGPMVLRVCRGVLGDRHEAEDAAQAAFLVLARRAGSIERRGSAAGWLYRVARRIAVRSRVASARRREVEALAGGARPPSGADGAQDVPAAELHEELDRLPERYRAPLVLCYLEGLTHEQAASRLGCPRRTVETRLARGRARLRETLLRRGVVPSAALVAASLAAIPEAPAAWLEATILAGSAYTKGRSAAAGVASAAALSLAEGALTTMIAKKALVAAAASLVLGGLALGGGLRAAARGPEPGPGVSPPAPATSAPVPSPTQEITLPRAGSKPPAVASDRKDPSRELALDDGKMAGKRSIAGGGHAVRFEAPGDDWTLTSVRIHGARYGYPRAPRENFAVFLCDEKFQKIAEFEFPYARFERGDSRWVTLEIKPTKVPRRFVLGVDFDPAQTKGVFVSHDAQSGGTSFVGLPGEEFRPFKQGDWMIRPRVEPGK